MTFRTSRGAHRRTATMLGVVLALGVTALAAPTAWGADDPGRAASSTHSTRMAPVPRAVSTPITRANAALTRATTELKAHHPRRAIAALNDLKYQLGRAHVAAMNQIGKPPTDPESDEPPGPPAVLTVLALEHRVGTRLVPTFDGRTRTDVVDALRLVLYSTHHRRDVILDRVIALPAEGARGDYEDGMADTLGQYTQEVNQLSTAVSTYRLTSAGKVALDNALTRVRATQAKVNAAFGGGE
jgi:hypothetical protein